MEDPFNTSFVFFLTIGLRLYYAEEKNSLMSQMSSQITSLRQKLISLRQDEVKSFDMRDLDVKISR